MAASAGRPTSAIFSIASSSRSRGDRSRCSRIGAWMFCLTVRPENKAPCWNSTPQRCSTRRRSRGGERVEIVAVDFDRAGALGQQPEDGAGEHRLAGARGADEAEHLAAADVEVEPVHHQMVAEADLQPAHADDDFAGARGFVESPARPRWFSGRVQ